MRTHPPTLALVAVLAGGLSLVPLAGAQPAGNGTGPATPPGATGPLIEQVQLTETTAKGAVDSYLQIKKEYGDDALPRAKPSAAMKGAQVVDGVTEIIEKHGFAGVEDWSKTVVSLAMAYGVVKEGKLAEMDASIAELDANPQIPEQMKAQLKKMLESTRPSDNNVKVVTALMKDDDYGPKLKQIQR